MAGLLAGFIARGADHPALTDEDGTTSWAELDRRVNQWIDVFRRHELASGDRVALVTTNRSTTFEALLACLHTGLVAVPVSWRLTAPEIAYLLENSQSRAVLTEPHYATRVAEAIATAGISPRLAAVTGLDAKAELEPVEKLLAAADSREPADQRSGSVMLYTSATTGRPKGVHTTLFKVGAELGRIERTTRMTGSVFAVPDAGRWLLVGPWYHAAQLFFSLFPLLRGCHLLLRRRFDAASTLTDLVHEQISGVHLVPTQLVRLLALEPATRATLRRDQLRLVWHGGAACPIDVKRRMIEWWGPVLTEYYAATEAGIVSTIDSTDWLARPGSVGRPVPPTEVVILDPDGVPCPVGVPGTVYVRRPAETDFRYHNAPEKTAAAHRAPGLFTVGDVGRLDQDGYLYLTGRTLDVIISGGVNIYPAEVEAALLTHPAVRDAAVFGIPDDEFGERAIAVVELDPAAGLAEADVPDALDTHCRDRLADYKRPRHYQVLAELPREPTGKLNKQTLRAPYWDRSG